MASLGNITVQIDAREVAHAVACAMRGVPYYAARLASPPSNVALPALAAAACVKSGRLRLSRRSFLFPFKADRGAK